MDSISQQIANLSPEQRTLFERRLKQKGLKQLEIKTIPRRDQSHELPLSFAQARLWFIQQLEPDNCSYNVPSALHLKGQLNVAVLEQTLNEIIRRHETLRTTFTTTVEKRPIQVVAAAQQLALPVLDLREIPQKQEVQRLVAEEARTPFDLTKSLLRLTLLRLGEAEHVLLMTAHHIISDRWSIGVFLQEMTVLYKAFSSGKTSPLPELPIQYADWATWQRQWLQGEVLEAQLAYWKQQFEGDLPVLELPSVSEARRRHRPRLAVPTYQGAQQPLIIPKALSDSIKALSAQEGVTLFTLLLAAFQVLLHRYTDQDDIVIGTDIANRNRAETEPLIGLLVNTLVLRTNLSGNPSFRELLNRVREVTLGAYAHQDLPFEKLVEALNPERNLSQMMPLFQVKFDLQLARVEPLELTDLTVNPLPYDNGTTKYELRLNLQDTAQGLQGQVEYSTDLFDAATITRMVEHFLTLLADIVSNPQQHVADLSLLSESERQRLLVEWNGEHLNIAGQCIHQLFEAQVERSPDAIAAISEDEQLTYQELNRAANKLAHDLQKLGVGPEAKVAICVERTLLMVVGLLGILKAGGAYVPLDPAYPDERLAFILEDSQVSVLLTQQKWLESLPSIPNLKVVCLDTDDQVIAQENPISGVMPNNLAYIIYTSGSTGRPKGVAIEHHSTALLVNWARSVYTLEELAGVLASTSICFDLSVFELFVPLSWGGTVILAANALHLLALPAAGHVTLINTVPSAIAQLLRNGMPSSVRTVNLAGEALQNQIVQQLQKSQIQQIFNLYGPSEDTTYSTYALVKSNTTGSPPIGRPIVNTQVYVLDRYLQPVPMGVPGELYIGGAGLARGYLNRAELTSEKFISNPFSNEPGARLYKTGDSVRYHPDANLEFLGRLDSQVKIRGFRIEIGEIEAILSQHPAVQTSVVVVQNESDDKRLVAYVVFAGSRKQEVHSSAFNVNELRRFLEKKLPGYMIPSAFVILEALPLLPNGKVDRRALPAPNLRSELAATYATPQTKLERTIASIWQKVLSIEKVGIHDNFFELGGHSLLGIEVIAQVSEALQVDLPLRSLFQSPTVAGLAGAIEADGWVKEKLPTMPTIMPNADERYKPFPLTDIQQAYLVGRNEAFELGNIATHGYREIEVGLEVERVNRALQRLIERHDMLRAIVHLDGQQQVLQQVPAYQIKVVDLRGKDQETVAAQLAEIRDRMSHQMLSTDRWPLFEIQAAQLAEDRNRFYISFDVLIGDAGSLQILWRELAQLIQNPERSLTPLNLSFRDYVLAEVDFRNSQLYRRSLDYWQSRLGELPPSPKLPLNKNLAAVKQPRFLRQTGKLDPDAWQCLKRRASQVSVTPSGVLLAAFAEILTVWSHSKFTINLTLFNRLPLHPQVNEIIGDFTSSTLLAVDNSAQESFEIRTRRIQKQLWEDLDHRHVSGVQILRQLARMQERTGEALMPVVFTSTLTQDIHEQTSASDWQVEVIYGLSQTSQVYLDHQVAEVEGALVFNWDAIEELFPPGLLDDMFAAYCNLLERLTKEDDIWQAKIRTLLPPAQLRQLAAINATEKPVADTLLHNLFFEQVPLHSQKAAVVTSHRTLTYQELSDRANQLGHQLRQLGVRPNQLVAIVMEKGWEQVVAALGILASGAAYLPIDSELPKERQWHLLEQGEVLQVLTQSWLNISLPENVLQICIDTPPPPAHLLTCPPAPSDLAYVIYTSGSTGLPKGVMIDHQGAVNTILDINQRFNVTSKDCVIALSSLSFDLSVYDIFGTLAAGGTIVMPNADATREPGHWTQLMAQHQVTIWNSVPALMQMLVEYGASYPKLLPKSLRLVMLSGDWLPMRLPNQIQSLFADIQVISLGGATEASIWSILYPIEKVDSAWRSIPYGRPMVNQRFYVLNQALELCPIWVTGQLYIAGTGLAQGYWKNKDKTNASFMVHPQTKERLYKTGDLGRYLPDGNIEFLGREDFQVKFNGYRIELGEIEATLQQHPGIKEAVVAVVGSENIPQEARKLVAYVVPDQTGEAEACDPRQLEGVLIDPLERIEFKLSQPGIRQLEPTHPSVELPLPEVDERLIQNYLQRQSYRQFIEEPISLEKFSFFLSCLLQIKLDDSPLPKFRYASAGSLYPVQTYLYIKPHRVEKLAAGIYYYHPAEHRLVLLSANAVQGSIYGGNQLIFEQAAFSLFLIGQLKAITPLDGEKAKEFCLIEAGYISQLLMEAAPKHEIGLCPIGALEFAELQDLFALESSHVLLHSFVAGGIDPTWTKQWQTTTIQQQDSVVHKLRKFLQQKLPDYMVPYNYMVLNALPLTSNGKVDRSALPALDTMHPKATDYVAPQTTMERTIVGVWQKALNVQEIGIQDNFFELGGNSLSATQVISQLRKTFQVELSIRRFFESPTVADQALAVQQSQGKEENNSINKIERIDRGDAKQILENFNFISEQEVDAFLSKMIAEEEFE